MQLRERSYLMDELGDPDAPIGSRLWCLWLANEIRKTLYDNQQTGTRLRYLVDAFKEHAAWQELGFLTWEDFCARKLQTEAEKVESEVAIRAQDAKANPPNGHHPTSDNCKTLEHGNSADYLTARIARDRPDILEAMKRGEYRSVRQAAIEAGIVNPKVRYSLPDDPIAAAHYLAQRVDREWFLALVDEYMKAAANE